MYVILHVLLVTNPLKTYAQQIDRRFVVSLYVHFTKLRKYLTKPAVEKRVKSF